MEEEKVINTEEITEPAAAEAPAEETEEEMKARVKEEIRKERKANLIEWVKDIVIAAVLACVILTFIKPIVIQQESMLDNYLPGDYVIISRQAYHLFGSPERGDVIVFRSDLEDEKGNDKNLIKRIVGLPGETVEIRNDGYVYIDDVLLDEPYLREQGISDVLAGTVSVTVGEDELFVCGDNRAVSLDSRAIGCIKQNTIMGKVKFIVFNTQGLRKGK